MAPSGPEVMELEEEPTIEPDPLGDWRTLYLNYLLYDALPMDKTKARRLMRRTKSFVLMEGELYKRSHTGILQRCIPIEQGKRLLSDIHGGVCGHHATPRTLVGNVFRQGFYWPTAVADAKQIVCTYERSEPADDGPSDPAPRADLPMAPPDPEVMELEVDPTTEPDPPGD